MFDNFEFFLLSFPSATWCWDITSKADEARKIKQYLEIKPEDQRPRGRTRMSYQSYNE